MQWLYVRHHGGQFLLRIEDTDRQRFVPDAEEKIYEALAWYGIDFDEGPRQGGECGPYKQSERLPLYQEHAQKLVAEAKAYYCFCSADDLIAMRKKQEENHQPPRYDGRCRDIEATVAAERATREAHVVRIKFPRAGVTTFPDLIRGEISFRNDLIDDQVLLKSDGWPTYHLAVVIDDHFMQINTVMRGEEWLSSTPKHIVLYEMFGWTAPAFAHLPLILGSDRSKLSKRHGSIDALQFREEGYLPEAMINFLALLGWNPKTEQEFFSREELIAIFDFSGINKSGAIFDREKLNWFNAQYLKKLSAEEILIKSESFIEQSGLLIRESGRRKTDILRYIEATRERLVTLADIPEAIRCFMTLPDYETDLLHWPKGNKSETKSRLECLVPYLAEFMRQPQSMETLEIGIKALIQSENLGMGNTLWPLRVALTGLKEGPSPFAAVYALGPSETAHRLHIAIQKLSS